MPCDLEEVPEGFTFRVRRYYFAHWRGSTRDDCAQGPYGTREEALAKLLQLDKASRVAKRRGQRAHD